MQLFFCLKIIISWWLVTLVRIDSCADHTNKNPDFIIEKYKIITSENTKGEKRCSFSPGLGQMQG